MLDGNNCQRENIKQEEKYEMQAFCNFKENDENFTEGTFW